MTRERVHRKLCAIFSADAKGYSQLMRNDEVSTVQMLKENQEIFGNAIEQFNGRVVDSPGDNILAEFMSAVDAVECAVNLQKGFTKKKYANGYKQNQMLFRIGLNLGDIIYENEKIYGDGVNIASRIEGLADPGGICISNTIYDQVFNKLDLSFEYMGRHELKNIDNSIKIYKIHLEERPRIDIAKAKHPVSIEKGTISIPETPSIAVMPFKNMSSDHEQDWFVDGFSGNIIAALSKTSRVVVIATNTTSNYKGKPVHARQVSRELGVRYVLEGSVQSALNRIRVLVQLIDSKNGKEIWADRFDRKLEDIFDIQDEIALKNCDGAGN